MSNLHPIFEKALAPYRPDNKYTGLTRFEYTTVSGTELMCWLDYGKAEPMTRDEPGHPATADLCIAEHICTDIILDLADSTVDEIEAAFLTHGVDE